MTKRIIGFSTIPTPNHSDEKSSVADSHVKKSAGKTAPSPSTDGESAEILALMQRQKESIERFKRRFPDGVAIEEGEFLSTK